jgi:hypothetical protein
MSIYMIVYDAAVPFGSWTWASILRKKNAWIQKGLYRMRLTLPGTYFIQNLTWFLVVSDTLN